MGASKQASKQKYIHTHIRNAVTLVWGLLRLAPKNINFPQIYLKFAFYSASHCAP